MQKPFLVGITGGSASGKTTFLRRLLASFPEQDICLISQDNYYHPRETQQVDGNGVTNFDLPSSIDSAAYANDVLRISQGLEVRRPEYTFNNPNAPVKELVFKPAPIVVVEGIFVFYFEEVARLLDLKVYIDAREHVKVLRRIVRDRDERGYDLEDVLYRYTNHVAPTYEKYIKPFKQDADLIIPNNHHFDRGLEVLVSFLKSKIAVGA
ncbi:uridine-cytidine kinase [Hymenobacter lutimineralis]|uniref:uridine/cytidine kinase n=1 Tax=Hymenobacter lutimineralis TaxID=2606448 RepID=A0A5D6V3B4_9BACT|nr:MULTISPECIES: uridine-cytidine kinase [Hymenobacter]QIX60959.1 uridine-cytidine kinase [Hymenobacter sp. BT18]TYZ09595.1 uridine-cytidine kinase [Hymenobacter lutimineralis]